MLLHIPSSAILCPLAVFLIRILCIHLLPHICAGLGIPQFACDMEESKCSMIVKDIYINGKRFFPGSCIKDIGWCWSRGACTKLWNYYFAGFLLVPRMSTPCCNYIAVF